MEKSIAELRVIAEDWIQAWNAKDLDRIMSYYSDEVEFEANTVLSRWNMPQGKLKGRPELREHFRLGLLYEPDLFFTLEQVFTAPSGYAILYQRDNGNQVLHVVELNEKDKAKKVRVFYSGEQK